MSTLSATTSMITQALAWALVHTLWQGAAIAAIIYILLKIFPRINVQSRYYLSFGGLTAITAWFADTWINQYTLLKGTVVYVSAHSEDGKTTTYAVRAAMQPGNETISLHGLTQLVESHTMLIFCCYLAGLAFMLTRFLVDIVQVRKLRKNGLLPLAPKYDALLNDCKKLLEITKPVQLYLSNRINVPMMLGTLKPIILLPVTTINHLTIEQVEAILLHELAHIKRYDYLLNMIQTVMETILFFNPFVWLLSSITRKEREHCCDDMVIAASTDPLPYAKALAILEHERINSTNLAMAANGNKHQLYNRIKRIMEMKKNKTKNSQLTIVLAAISIITLSMMFTFSPSFAQKAKKAKADTVVKNFSMTRIVTIDSNGHKTVTEKTSGTRLNDQATNMHKESDEGELPEPPLAPEPPMAPEPQAAPVAPKSSVSTVITIDNNGHKKIVRKQTNTAEADDEQTQAGIEQANAAMANVGAEIAKAMADAKKATAQATATMKAIDWDAISESLQSSIKVLQGNLANKELTEEVGKKVTKQWEESIKALKRSIKEIDENKRQANTKVMTETIEGNDLRYETDYEAMIEQMSKDGLIDKQGKYDISKANGQLYINGKKQSAAVCAKYSNYLKSSKLAISGNKGMLNISIND